MKFKRRTTAPENSNKYYIRKLFGGYSPCIAGLPNAIGSLKSSLANCVGYAWGRSAEICNNPLLKIGYQGVAGSHPVDAYNWYKYANNVGFKTGNKPKLGAVACWRNSSNTSGHVAVVEHIMPNGCVVVSESSYKGYIWRETTLSSTMYKKGLIFQGFIYQNEDFEEETDEELRVGDIVEITGEGNSQANGRGLRARGIGYKRYIYKIYKGYAYPYRVGYMNGVTTGYYMRGALKKVK